MNGKSSDECLDFSDTYVKFSYPVEWYDFDKNENTTINKIITLYLEGDILSSNPDNIYYGEVYCRAGYDPNKNS